MDRFIDTIEWIAAVFVGIVAADIFISVLLRYFFSYAIPDAYDFGRLLLGILIFWGIAATSYRGNHITVDLVWARCRPALPAHRSTCSRRWCCCSSSRCRPTRCSTRCASTYADNVLTFDLRLPTWPFFAVAWLGDVSAVLLIAVRTYRLIFQPELMTATNQDQAGRVRPCR